MCAYRDIPQGLQSPISWDHSVQIFSTGVCLEGVNNVGPPGLQFLNLEITRLAAAAA